MKAAKLFFKKGFFWLTVLSVGCLFRLEGADLNRNGKVDPYEDSARSVEDRVEDLLGQMTLEEKTCQLATLYGTGRVLKDRLPTPSWKQEIWKDGIANIDEQLNGVPELGPASKRN